MTPIQKRALEIVRDNPGIRPREFAKQMWPDSDGWMKPCKSGNKGTHRGGGMYLSGGAYLGKLYRAGFVVRTHRYQWDTGYALTGAGREALKK